MSDWLVDTGCLYMSAWGVNCSSWDDSVDDSNLREWPNGDIPGGKFVLTTWHENEPLSDVIWFSKYTAHHPDIELCKSVILHISEQNSEAKLLESWSKA